MAFMSFSIDYFSFVVGFIVFMFVLEFYIHSRQHSLYLIKKPPSRIKNYVSEDKFVLTQAYKRDKSLFQMTKMIADLISPIYFCYKIRNFYDLSKTITLFLTNSKNDNLNAITFYILFTTLIDLMNIPFHFYDAFVIETRHGFNKMSLTTFFTDSFKYLLLKYFIGVPIVYIYLRLVTSAGNFFPFFLWFFLLVVKLIMITLYPVVIQPCFNRVKELTSGDLKKSIESMAFKLDYPLKKIYIIDGSRRSSHSNAYLYGFCENKRIVLYDTLVEQCSNEQIVAVLAHELGHWKRYHVLKMFFVIEWFFFGMFYAMKMFLFERKLYESFGMEEKPIFVGTILFLMIFEPVQQLRALVCNYIVRCFEFQADDFAVKLGYAEKLSEALLTLERKNMSGFLTDPLYSLYHDTHPPVIQRIERLKKSS